MYFVKWRNLEKPDNTKPDRLCLNKNKHYVLKFIQIKDILLGFIISIPVGIFNDFVNLQE